MSYGWVTDIEVDRFQRHHAAAAKVSTRHTGKKAAQFPPLVPSVSTSSDK
jgi:hypothetical protein